MVANYQQRLRQGFGLGRFMLLRFGRLDPFYGAMLFAFIGIEVLQVLIPSLGAMGATAPSSAARQSLARFSPASACCKASGPMTSSPGIRRVGALPLNFSSRANTQKHLRRSRRRGASLHLMAARRLEKALETPLPVG